MAYEMLDIVNDDDMVIGHELRSLVHQRGLQHRGVHIFLFTQDGRLLVQQRSRDRTASPSLLDCSVSEHVQVGEDYLAAAIRGMQEELGVKKTQLREVLTFRMNYGPNDNEISRIFQGSVDPRSVKFDPVEIEQITYYGLNELVERMDKNETDFCYWFVQIVKWSTGKQSPLNVLKIHENIRIPWFPIK